MFNKIGKEKTLSQQIFDDIEAAILDKKFSADEKLPSEKELCTMFGVSRTAVREAVQMLSARGLIYVHKGKGIYASDYKPDNVIKPMSLFLELNLDSEYMVHIIRVRRILEPEIAHDAALNRTADETEQLRMILMLFKQTSENEYEKLGELDRDFHLVIARACRNPIIPVIMEPIYELMPKIKTLVYKNIDIARTDADLYHEKIYQAIKAKKSDKAHQLTITHLAIAEQHISMLKGNN